MISKRRALVVGASSGIGRDIGVALARQGAAVAFAARRVELVEAAAKEAGERCEALQCDVGDDGSCERVVAEAVERLGGLDTLVYAAAIGPLVKLADADGERWRSALGINVIGAALVTRAAIGPLEASGAGKALYLSSVAGRVSQPWPGLGLYGVSKAALERLVESWRGEHPAVRFSTLVLGPTERGNDAPNSFGDDWDAPLAMESMERWATMGLATGGMVATEDLCAQVLAMLSATASVPFAALEP